MDLQKHNIRFVSPYEVLSDKEKDFSVTVAYSGGADSSLLLYLVAEDSKKYGYKVYVAHFNHKIRGEEATRDEKFCVEVAKKYGFECFVGSADIPSLAEKSGLGIECVAREYRYAFLSDTLKKVGCRVLLTAHNADDRAETFFINLLRGSGINGLSGLKEARRLSDGQTVFRPILDSKKEDIYAFCRENGIAFVEDSTNSDTNYLRNNIRHNLMPEILKLKPDFYDVIKRTTDILSTDADFLSETAGEFSERYDIKNGVALSNLDIHPSVLGRVISIYFGEFSEATLESVHISEILGLIKNAKNGSSVSLPDKYKAKIRNGRLFFEKEQKRKVEDFSVPLDFGKSETAYYIINVEKINSVTKPEHNQLILSGIEGLYFSPRKESDEILVSSMHKKVRKLQNEKKAEPEIRNSTPILRNSSGEVLWVPEVALSDLLKNDKNGTVLVTVTKK